MAATSLYLGSWAPRRCARLPEGARLCCRTHAHRAAAVDEARSPGGGGPARPATTLEPPPVHAPAELIVSSSKYRGKWKGPARSAYRRPRGLATCAAGSGRLARWAPNGGGNDGQKVGLLGGLRCGQNPPFFSLPLI